MKFYQGSMKVPSIKKYVEDILKIWSIDLIKLEHIVKTFIPIFYIVSLRLTKMISAKMINNLRLC